MKILLLPAEPGITAAVALLKEEEVVALPTETVYGLAGNAFSSKAVASIFEAKQRPLTDPLIVHLLDVAWLDRVVSLTPECKKLVEQLAAAFWPGPLTLLLPRASSIPDLVTAGLETVAVRVPAHPVFRKILEQLDLPLAAPSANRFGRISPTTAANVEQELGDRIPLIVDGGSCHHGLESTIVWPHDGVLQILRPGPITAEQLSSFGKVMSQSVHGKAPGSLKSHYAPRKKLSWFDETQSPSQEVGLLAFQHAPLERFQKSYSRCSARNENTACQEAAGWTAEGSPAGASRAGASEFNHSTTVYSDTRGHEHRSDAAMRGYNSFENALGFGAIEILSPSGDLKEAAANLYGALRRLDESDATSLVVERVPEQGIGCAIMDRLRRAVTE